MTPVPLKLNCLVRIRIRFKIRAMFRVRDRVG